MQGKHDNKEDEKQSLLHSIVSFHSIRTQLVQQRKRKKKDVIFKSEYLSRQIHTKTKKKTLTKRSCVCAEKKQKYNYDMEAEGKTGPKNNTIIQMKEREKN